MLELEDLGRNMFLSLQAINRLFNAGPTVLNGDELGIKIHELKKKKQESDKT